MLTLLLLAVVFEPLPLEISIAAQPLIVEPVTFTIFSSPWTHIAYFATTVLFVTLTVDPLAVFSSQIPSELLTLNVSL